MECYDTDGGGRIRLIGDRTVVQNLALTDQARDNLLRYFTAEWHNLYGLVNGVTRLAQDFADPDTQVDLERAAGNILTAPAWLRAVA